MASRAGLSRSTLVHAAGGRRVLTTQALARICRTLPDVQEFKELFWSYIRYEIPVGSEEVGVLPVHARPADTLPERERDALLGYVRAFPTRFVDGSGLVIVSGQSRVLSAAAALVSHSLTSSGVAVMRRLATDPVHASEIPALERARLLVLERVDFAKPPARNLLALRLERFLPVAVTTATSDLAPCLGATLARALRDHCGDILIPPLHG